MSTALAYSKLRLGLIARLAILGVVFFLEKILLNVFVDFQRAQEAEGFGAIVRDAQHWGFRFLVALAATVALFAYVRGGERLRTAAAAIRQTPLRGRWICAHLAMVACLVPLSYLLYRAEATSLPFAAVVALWLATATGAALSAAAAMAPWRLWRDSAMVLGSLWWYSIITALLAASAMQLSQRLWVHTASLTFSLVRYALLPFIPTLSADPVTRILRSDHFAVEVSEICSGLEGMGLILAFTTAWLMYFRREYIFPRALVLIPIGLVGMFALNVVRIAALMLIGHSGFPAVAEYGFHSQAGWIAFNTAACLLVFLSRRSTWLNRAAAAPISGPAENPTAAYLMPLLALLAAGVLSKAMSSGFESLYALRAVAVVGALAFYRKKLAALEWRWSWRGPMTGVAVFVVWMISAHFLLPAEPIPVQLSAWPPALRGIWIAGRVATAVVLVPLAEELAYRGYIMRRLSNSDFESVTFQQVAWSAVAVTAVVFGFAHGALWLPGIAAGIAFGALLVRSGSLGEAVAAHATANALIAVSVLGGNLWELW